MDFIILCFIAKITNACCVLHNIMRAWGVVDGNGMDIHYDEIDLEGVIEELDIADQDDGYLTREAFINNWYRP